MSQEKVDRYKEEKKNRQKIMKKQKIQFAALKAAGLLVALVFVGWIGFSIYQEVTANSAAKSNTYSVDTAAVDEYLNQMSSEAAETEGTETETEGTETETTAPESESAETEAETAPQTEAVTE